MALLGMWTFDDNVAAEPSILGWRSPNWVVGRSGVGGAMLVDTGTGGLLAVPATSNIVVGWGYQNLGVPPGATSFFRLMEGSVTHLSLRYNSSNSKYELYRGDGTTLLATSSANYRAPAIWCFLEAKAVIDDASGSFELKQDEQSILTYSGDTRNGGTSGVIDRFEIKAPGGGGGNPYAYVDDVYALDSSGSAPYNDFLGDIVVRTLLPNADGDSSQWLGSDGNSTNNYALVNEVNSSMAQYTGSQTPGNRDLYNLGDLPATYDVLATQAMIYSAKSDGGAPPDARLVEKGASGGIRTGSNLITQSTTPQVTEYPIQTTDPDGNPLTPARVNAMQTGIEIV